MVHVTTCPLQPELTLEIVQIWMASFAAFVIALTRDFIGTDVGKAFLFLPLVGPLTFLPTVWQAYQAADIRALKTWTWPLMVVVNTAAFVSVCHNGDWQMQLCMIAWVVLMVTITFIIVMRHLRSLCQGAPMTV